MQTQTQTEERLRYGLTHINKDGNRQITTANQGRCFFDDKRKALSYLKAFNENNAESTLIQVFGKQALGTFAISPLKCWNNGDAKGIYPDETI